MGNFECKCCNDHMALQSVLTNPLVREILEKLKSELPSDLFYHSYVHTHDVMREALNFGSCEQLSQRELFLLGVAAAFHDCGYLKSRTNNEPIAADMAKAALEKDESFSSEEIELICQLILDTSLVETSEGLKQEPSTILSRYLLDADLSNLGRDDFFEKFEAQRREIGVEQLTFAINTLSFMNSHVWYTDIAKSLRNPTKLKNIDTLIKIIEGLESRQET